MPLLVHVNDLTAGSRLCSDVTGENGQLFLARGTELTDGYIQRIRDMQVAEYVRISVSAEDEEKEPPVISDATAIRARTKVEEIFSLSVRKKIITSSQVNELASTVNAVIKDIMESKIPVLGQMHQLQEHDDYTYGHCWTVFVTGIALIKECVQRGLIQEPDYTSMNSFGIGAMLHDIGKTQIPLTLLNKKENLTADELMHIRCHAYMGYDSLKVQNLIPPMAASMALHHHQRWDGTGYGPKNGLTMKGGEIPFRIRVLTLADAYDAMVSDRPYRRGVTSGEAVIRMDAESGRQFDPALTDIIRHVIPRYPEGCVLLSKEGTLFYLKDAVMFGSPVKATPVGSIIGRHISYSPRGIVPDEVALCANSVSHMAELIKKRYSSELTPSNGLSIRAIPPFDEILRKSLEQPARTLILKN